MFMTKPGKHFYEFDQFRIDVAERLVLRDGSPLTLPPKAFDILLALVRESGHVLEKHELIDIVWPDTFIEENNLTQYISALRKALGDDRREHRYIETVARRGYRFLAPVRQVRDDGPALIIGNSTRVRVVIKEEKVTKEETSTEQKQPLEAQVSTSSRGLWLSIVGHRNSAITSATIVLALAAAYFAFLRPAKTRPVAYSPRTLAVLPFRNLKRDAETEFLSFSLADAVAGRLGNVNQLVVRPLAYTDKYRDREIEPEQVAKELNVEVLLTGSFIKEGDDLRVTSELIDVVKNEVLWRGTMDLKYDKLLTVQDRVANNVIQGLNLKLTAEEVARISRNAPQNPQAYEAYLKGRYFWNRRTDPDIRKGISYFRVALEKDPNYALAYSATADSYFLLGDHAEARVAAKRALEIDDTLAEARTTIAGLYLLVDFNWPEAEREFKRAIELNPNYVTAHHWYAYYFATMGQMDQALVEIKRAQELDPLSLIINTDLGQMLYYSRQYDQAIAQLRRTVELDPNFSMAHMRLGEAYVQKGSYEEAIAEFQKANKLSGRSKAFLSALTAHAYAMSGQSNKALQTLHELKESEVALRPLDYSYPTALTYLGLGEKDQAFRWLEQAFAQHDGNLALLKVEPKFDSLRSDARFTDLLRHMNLTP